jgi:hypothetical protein
MHVVTLTFPGHFFQTVASIQSTQKWYQVENPWYVFVDDSAVDPWHTYPDDLSTYLQDFFPSIEFQFILTSSLDKFKDCKSGWWRQQLVKLQLDLWLPEQQWFVIDGDVVFESNNIIDGVTPISRDEDPNECVTILSANYVKTMLGIDRGRLDVNGEPVTTNAIPFRVVTRELLQGLRQHIEQKFNKNFMNLHLEWFANKTIVAYSQNTTDQIMTEWELIELYRHYVLKQTVPFSDIGSGYPLMHRIPVTEEHSLYRHSYQRDCEIPVAWFEKRGITIPQAVWGRSLAWTQHNEPDRFKNQP